VILLLLTMWLVLHGGLSQCGSYQGKMEMSQCLNDYEQDLLEYN